GARRDARVARPRSAPARARNLRARVAGRVRSRAGRGAHAGRAARPGPRRRRLGRGRPAARHDRGGRLGRPRCPGGRRLPARAAGVTADLVYGRRAVRELLRGRRQALEIWATERAVGSEPWLAESPIRVPVRPERELTALAGTRDHQGVVARAEPYRYADAWELAATESPLLVCLDRVSDPRNLGAVCRSAEGAGATGVVVPEHGSARVTAVV